MRARYNDARVRRTVSTGVLRQMKLTAKQERMVREFLREAEQAAASLEDSAQRRTVNSLRQRLRHELESFGDEIPRDQQVFDVFERCRAAETPAPKAAPTTKREPNSPATSLRLVERTPVGTTRGASTDGTRIWAGVCASWADRLQVDAVVVRAAFVTLGFVMPPLAFVVYLVLYTELAWRGDGEVPPAESGTLFLRGLSASVQVLALFLAGNLAPWLVIDVCTRFLPELLIRLGAWGWYGGIEWPAFWFVLLLAPPMNAVASLPLLHDWDKTLRLLTRLVIAAYAVLISFGIASGLVGAAIEVIDHLTR